MPQTRTRYLLVTLLVSVVSMAACAGSGDAGPAAQVAPTRLAQATNPGATRPTAPVPTATLMAQSPAGPLNQLISVAPDFTLPSTRGEFNLRTFNQGKKLVIAFYVEDGTPG